MSKFNADLITTRNLRSVHLAEPIISAFQAEKAAEREFTKADLKRLTEFIARNEFKEST